MTYQARYNYYYNETEEYALLLDYTVENDVLEITRVDVLGARMWHGPVRHKEASVCVIDSGLYARLGDELLSEIQKDDKAAEACRENYRKELETAQDKEIEWQVDEARL